VDCTYIRMYGATLQKINTQSSLRDVCKVITPTVTYKGWGYEESEK